MLRAVEYCVLADQPDKENKPRKKRQAKQPYRVDLTAQPDQKLFKKGRVSHGGVVLGYCTLYLKQLSGRTPAIKCD